MSSAAEFLAGIQGMRWGLSEDGACPYFGDGRMWQNLIVIPDDKFSPRVHEYLLESGFRRSGFRFYRPSCDSCRECRSLRVDVMAFRATRSQRRVWRRNQDLSVEFDDGGYTEEKRALLERYLDARHDSAMTAEEEAVRKTLFSSPGGTIGVAYRLRGELVGYGLTDLTPNVLSSVYFFFEPNRPERSLGTYSMLFEIALAERREKRFYHPGFFIASCPSMNYKARLTPSEILDDGGEWVALAGL